MIDYKSELNICFRSMVRKLMRSICLEGLKGDQHLYISFVTFHKDVVIPEYLRIKYPKEMILVMQYEFSELQVFKDYFSVKMTFDKEEQISIPFRAITSITDPSENFSVNISPDFEGKEIPESEDEKEKSSNIIFFPETKN
ncbi:ClpXP protease specificity-enhancing factor SspB [Candidatus Nesciobacter abundans]|uniref:Stringent starvation protein B n=1 Tax=Candidatus Nesciobacter abundans TaxID=2601668 RepID=A0A5C0UHF6_9PROT|nr:ClpXP protease specificity-enhancing factor SspB [Candidatus Nesciobacter abundans]QEK39189.1 hypothetical protein FZC36_01970 [Candidatus Nesciobacter abundans]